MRYNHEKMMRIARKVFLAFKNDKVEKMIQDLEKEGFKSGVNINIPGESKLEEKDHELYELEYNDNLYGVNFVFILKIQTDYDTPDSVGKMKIYISPDKKNVYNQEEFATISNTEIEKLNKEIKEIQAKPALDKESATKIDKELSQAKAQRDAYQMMQNYLEVFNDEAERLSTK